MCYKFVKNQYSSSLKNKKCLIYNVYILLLMCLRDICLTVNAAKEESFFCYLRFIMFLKSSIKSTLLLKYSNAMDIVLIKQGYFSLLML